MSTSKEMRICVYSDSDKTVLKRALEPGDYDEFHIEGLEEPKTNICNGQSFIKKCGIAKRIIPFELKPKLFKYIDHINVIGGHYLKWTPCRGQNGVKISKIFEIE